MSREDLRNILDDSQNEEELIKNIGIELGSHFKVSEVEELLDGLYSIIVEDNLEDKKEMIDNVRLSIMNCCKVKEVI